jgi:hypothetical protein
MRYWKKESWRRMLGRKALKGRMLVGVVGTTNFLNIGVNTVRESGLGDAVAFPFTSRIEALCWLASPTFRSVDVIYQRGGADVWYICGGALFGKPVIKHWTGTDTNHVRRGNVLTGAFRHWVYRAMPAYHLAVNKHVAGRVEREGIKVRGCVRSVTPFMDAAVSLLPEKFTVLGYWRKGRREFYGGDQFLELARRHPEVQFLVVGVDEHGEPTLPNVKYLGIVDDMDAVFRQASVLVRLPESDGAPNMPVEMLLRGRPVIYNHDHIGCYVANDIEEVSRILLELAEQKEPDIATAELVRCEMRLEAQACRFRDIMLSWCFE